MVPLIQKIEFVFGYEQILRMLQKFETTGIIVSLGVTETGAIVIQGSGISIDEQGVMTPTSDTEGPCPIPPGCPDNPACAQKILAVMPPDVTTGTLGLKERIDAFLNK